MSFLTGTWHRSASNDVFHHRRPPNDTWIAACCLAGGLPLATFNVKDFEDFAHYEGMAILTS